MRVVAVVTLFTPDGAYGGPTRVALNQARALRERGHDVALAGGAAGFGHALPTTVDGVPVRLFPAKRLVPGTGFAGLSSPGLHRWLKRAAPGADIAHLHLARDLVTLPAARRVHGAGVPYVVQTHGMIDASSHPLAGPLDAVWTRPSLRRAARVLYLTDRERRDVTEVAHHPLALDELSNGITLPAVAAPDRPAEVLYLARLAPRKRPLVFVEAAQRLARELPDVRFTLVGPDEGEGPAVRALLARDDAGGRITWEGPLPIEATQARVSRATVSVLPSVDEPFPMSVIEAMAAAVPVVVTDTCGLAGRIARAAAGVVVEPSVESLVAGVRSLLTDPEQANAAGARGRALCADELSMDAVATRLEAIYEETLAGGPVATSRS